MRCVVLALALGAAFAPAATAPAEALYIYVLVIGDEPSPPEQPELLVRLSSNARYVPAARHEGSHCFRVRVPPTAYLTIDYRARWTRSVDYYRRVHDIFPDEHLSPSRPLVIITGTCHPGHTALRRLTCRGVEPDPTVTKPNDRAARVQRVTRERSLLVPSATPAEARP